MNVPFWKRHEEPEDASFPQLVFAHFLRQRELYAAAYDGAPNTERALHGPADEEYRRKLAAFTRKHGEIMDAYWCSHEISGVALTGRKRWSWRGLIPHREVESKLHTATDWATRHSQEISSQLYACEAMAIRANEVLLGTSERIVMRLLHSLCARLLAVVDSDSAPDPAIVAKAVAESKTQMRQIRRYYDRAGQKAVRIIYVGGMLAGLGLVGIALLWLWAAGASDAVLTAVGMGGVGAVVSVLSRMANRDSRFALDHDDVGQKEARRLGAFRPFIGATFGALLYLAIASNLVSISSVDTKALPSIAVIAFLAGFSERWAKVVLDLAPPTPQPDARPPERPGAGEQEEAAEEAALGARR